MENTRGALPQRAERTWRTHATTALSTAGFKHAMFCARFCCSSALIMLAALSQEIRASRVGGAPLSSIRAKMSVGSEFREMHLRRPSHHQSAHTPAAPAPRVLGRARFPVGPLDARSWRAALSCGLSSGRRCLRAAMALSQFAYSAAPVCGGRRLRPRGAARRGGLRGDEVVLAAV